MNKFPLRNVRILDLTQVIAGPVSTRLLSHMGAQVIKIESRKRPDIIRVLPPFVDDNYPMESLYAANTFRNQLGVAVDLTSPKGLELARETPR